MKRASLRMQLGAPEESLHDLQMAAELGPENSDVFHHRGQVFSVLLILSFMFNELGQRNVKF